MKTKQEIGRMVATEARRCGLDVGDRLAAFANIVYLIGALDAVQDERRKVDSALNINPEKKGARRGK